MSSKEMNSKYNVFFIYIKRYNPLFENQMFFRYAVYSYDDMLSLVRDTLLDDDIKCLCVQYGYSYGDLYRFNGEDCLTPREETKSFKKMVLEYKLGGNDLCLE